MDTLITDDLGKVNRRAALHVQAARLYARKMPLVPQQQAAQPIADNRFFGEGYYNQTECPQWYGASPIYFPRWKKLKGFQKTK